MGLDAPAAVPVDVAERAAVTVVRQLGVGGRPQLLRSGTNTVFRVGDRVVRVSPADVDVAGQIALVERLSEQGVTALGPIVGPVLVDGFQVTVWEFIEGGRHIDYQPGGAIATLHRLAPDLVAQHVALPWCGDAAWLDVTTNLDAAAATGVVSDQDITVLGAAVRELAGWQEAVRHEELVVCHGDVHPQNVLMRGDEVAIIDWDSICLGPAAWDHAALLTWADRWGGNANDYEAFAAGYGSDLRASLLAQLLAQVRLLSPTINMIIKGEASRRHAEEARLRMRYWRGETSPPPWTAQ